MGFFTNMLEDASSYLLIGNQHDRGWAIRLTKSGSLQWDYGLSDGYCSRCGFLAATKSIDGNGYVFVGYKNDDATHDNTWLLSVNESGGIKWSKYFKDPDRSTTGKSISPTSDGKYLIGGESQNASFYVAEGYLNKVSPDGVSDIP